MIDQDSHTLFEILNERIKNKTSENEYNRLKSEMDEEKELLLIKIDNLTSNNNLIREENKGLSLKNEELTKLSFTQELTIKELESKYNELMASMEKHYNHYNENMREDESVLISMQLSEVRGKLEAKEKSFQKFREEFDRIVHENNNRIQALQQDNELLKDKSLKYDILREKYERSKNEDNSSLKHTCMKYEKTIKDLEDKLKFFKNFSDEKNKLLTKIEELHIIIEENTEAMSKLIKENNFYKGKLVTLESDNHKLKRELDFSKSDNHEHNEGCKRTSNISNEDSNNNNNTVYNKNSLLELEDNSFLQKNILELEMKVIKYLLNIYQINNIN